MAAGMSGKMHCESASGQGCEQAHALSAPPVQMPPAATTARARARTGATPLSRLRNINAISMGGAGASHQDLQRM